MLSPNLKRSIEVSNLCKNILAINCRIQQVSFINRKGRIIESRFRENIESPKLTKQEFEMLSMQCTLQISMNKEFEEKLSRVSYTLIKRESTLDFILPLYDGIIFVVVEGTTCIQQIGNKILELLRTELILIEDLK